MSHRAMVIAVVSTVAIWLMPSSVSAALWLTLDSSSGPSGTVVHGATVGSGAVTLAKGQTLELFLVSKGVEAEVADPADGRLVPLGVLVVDANGDGTTTFAIPTVDPGGYHVLVHCEPCAVSSAGATMHFVADLEVIRGEADPLSVWLPLALVALAGLAGFILFRRTSQ